MWGPSFKKKKAKAENTPINATPTAAVARGEPRAWSHAPQSRARENYSLFPHSLAWPFVRDSAHWLGPALERTEICLGSARCSFSAVSKNLVSMLLESVFQVGAASSGDCWDERMLLSPSNTHTDWAGSAEVHLPLETEETQKGEG